MGLAELLAHDVRELQHMLEIALQGRQAGLRHKQREFYALVHDAKNALAGIASCADVLGAHALPAEQQAEFLGIIGGEIDRVMGIAQKLASLAAGPQTSAAVEDSVAVHDVFHDLEPVLRRALAGRNIALHMRLERPARLRIDRESLTMIILNIVYNARDAMPDGGRMSIRSQVAGDAVTLEFLDTGCGMSPELQARFLEPFVTEGKPHGSGLGMALVKECLDAHHARILVTSEPGHGTRVVLMFPLAAEQEPQSVLTKRPLAACAS